MKKYLLMGMMVAVLLFGLMLLGCPSPGDESEIEEYGGNGHSYQIIDKKMSWTEAKSYCEGKGGYLVTITSAGEQAFIENFLERKGNKSVYWLGGFRASNGNFQWVTGESFTYTNWANGEPNGYFGGEDKIQLADFLYGHWNDGEDEFNPDDDSIWRVLGFVCEWDEL